MLRNWSPYGNASLHSDIAGYGFYIITVFEFLCIILMYTLSIELPITDFHH